MTQQTNLQSLWASFLHQLDPGNILDFVPLPASRELDVYACKYLFMQLAQAYPIVFHIDEDHPEFLPFVNHVFNIGGPNPDSVYYFTRINGKGVYRITGYRNTVHYVDLQTGSRFWGLSDPPGETFPNQSLDDFEISKDGSFDILMGSEKPPGYQGNWMQIDPRADHMLLRQVCYSPKERDARLAIERVDKKVPKKEMTPAQIEENIQVLINYFNRLAEIFPRMRYRGADNHINELHTTSYGVGSVNQQVYHHGMWELDDSEALLCEVKVPEQCFYWNVQAGDLFWQTLEQTFRQSTLNGATAHTDSDGIIRVVLSHQDPGIPNWVDTGGLNRGDFIWRWLKCSSTPEIKLRKIPFSDLAKQLPKDAPRLTPEQRMERLREYAIDCQLRRRW